MSLVESSRSRVYDRVLRGQSYTVSSKRIAAAQAGYVNYVFTNPYTSDRSAVPYLMRVFYGTQTVTGDITKVSQLVTVAPTFLSFRASTDPAGTSPLLPALTGVPSTVLPIQPQSAGVAVASSVQAKVGFSATAALGGGYDLAFEYAVIPNTENIYGDPYDGPYYVNPGVVLGFSMAVAANTITLINQAWWEE